MLFHPEKYNPSAGVFSYRSQGTIPVPHIPHTFRDHIVSALPIHRNHGTSDHNQHFLKGRPLDRSQSHMPIPSRLSPCLLRKYYIFRLHSPGIFSLPPLLHQMRQEKQHLMAFRSGSGSSFLFSVLSAWSSSFLLTILFLLHIPDKFSQLLSAPFHSASEQTD